MLAKEAVEGRTYQLEVRGSRPNGCKAECIGWNGTREFLLFLYFDKYGARKILMVGPREEIK